MIRSMILILLATFLLLGAILTWGSVGSAILVFCLITMGSALLFQKFVTNRDEDYFQED